jgi:hypothetical protein
MTTTPNTERNTSTDLPYIDTAATRYVLTEVLIERQHQVQDHGWDPSHDDLHGPEDFGWLCATRAVGLCQRDAAAVADARRVFVEIAAIAVAAIESLDRKGARREAFTNQAGL